MCAKSKKVGIRHIIVSYDCPTVSIRGSKESPYHVVIKSAEEGGFIGAEVPFSGYYEDTPVKTRQNVNWIWSSIMENEPAFTKDDANMTKGAKIKGTLSKKFCGSALYWLEAFMKSPENKPPTGFFVSGRCTPKITSAKWCKYKEDNKGSEIQESDEILFGDMLQLHIETEGLNGDILEVLFHEDEDNTIIDKTHGQVFWGTLIVNVPIKVAWRSQLFNATEKMFGDDLVLKVIIKHPSLNNSGSYFGKPLTIKNDLKEKAIDKGSAVPVNIGKVEADAKKYEPCLFTGIKVTNNNQTYAIFEEGKDSNLESKKIDVVAGDDANKKDVLIHVEGLKTNPDVQCNKTGGHKGNIFLVKPINQLVIKEKKDDRLSLKVAFDYSEIKGGFGFKAFNYFFLPYIKPQVHMVKVCTCRYDNGFEKEVPIYVYPDIEWELAFLITIAAGSKTKFNFQRDKLELFHKDVGLKFIKSSLNVESSREGGLGFALALKYKKDGIKEYDIISAGIKQTISNTIGVFNLVMEYLAIFDGRGKETKSSAIKKGLSQTFEFNIDPPNIGLALKWGFKNTTKNIVVADYIGAVLFKPLLGLKIGVDLIAVIGETNKVFDFIEWVLEKVANAQIYIMFEVFAVAKGELNLAYNKIDGFKNKGKQKAELEIGVDIKAGIRSRDKIFVATVTKGGITETTEIEKWKVEGMVGTSFSFKEEIGYDANGHYKESTIVWNGITLTVTVYFYSSKIKELPYTEYAKKIFPIMNKTIIGGPNKEYINKS
jgi:hypothetical protein